MNKAKITTNSELISFIEGNNIEYVDFLFSDIRGTWHHLSVNKDCISEKSLNEGFMFDGSSISGWQDISKSDMKLLPDITSSRTDPFAALATVKIICDVIEPTDDSNYALCPRSIAKKAEQHLIDTGIADCAYFGPEAEFFVFDDVRINVESNKVAYQIDSEEGPYNLGKEYAGGNKGHRPKIKGGYFPESPVDSLSDMRSEMLTIMKEMGLSVEKHHHEVASSQCELGIKYSSLLNIADNMQTYKHVVKNVAHAYGKTATFMPKPVYGDNGSGMHCHQSLWKNGKNLFAGSEYAGLSETALHYIGGIIAHARALNAFTNPTTNSYKRLVPGFEAPVLLSYSARNRSAACRIPFGTSPQEKRVEVRFPDPTANPYLAFSAMLLAGLDGIKNKINPGEAIEKNLYEATDEELAKIPTVCRSLQEALNALSNDHEFLTSSGVFSAEIIYYFMKMKYQEIEMLETTPHPVEYYMYYSS